MSADPDLSRLPAPLVPPEINLRGLVFMPLDVQRLLDSDFYAKSSGDEFKAALTLWCKAFAQSPAGSLPSDDLVLAKLSGTGRRWRKLRPVALHGWVRCSDGRLYHRVVAEKVFDTWRFRQAQRERAAKRWSTPPAAPAGDATAMPRHHHGTYTEDAPAYPTALPGQSHGNAIRNGVEGKGVEVPPPSPPLTQDSSNPSSSASSSSERTRDGGGNGETMIDVKGNTLPAGNGLIAYDPEKCAFIGLSGDLAMKWQDMFFALSIPDQVARAAAWLHAHREERAAIERDGCGFEQFLMRWLLREVRPKSPPAGSSG